MRLNKFLALATGMSRRAADTAVSEGRVRINTQPATTGYDVRESDTVSLDGSVVTVATTKQTVILNKPAGYVVSRDGQGSKTIYELLPLELHNLKPVGRLDKESSGLLLITNDGELANNLTHPSHQKLKIYVIGLLKPLQSADENRIAKAVQLEDGPSKLDLKSLDTSRKRWQVSMSEGRNRQIRRTFEALGYTVISLHRTHFGPYSLDDIKPGAFKPVD